jgi:hypothetical protein
MDAETLAEVERLENWPIGAMYDHKPHPKEPRRIRDLVDGTYFHPGGPNRILRIDLDKDDSRLALAYLKANSRHHAELTTGEGVVLNRIRCKLDQSETKFVTWDDEEQLRVLSASLFCGAKDER